MGMNFFDRWAAQKQGGGENGYEIELAKAKMMRPKEVAEDAQPEGQLTIDVCQTADDIIVESAIAGIRPEDIEVNVTDDSVSIRGSRYHEVNQAERDYLYQECYWGRFARSVILPEAVDPDSAEVTFKNGVLTVRLPKVNRKKTRKLKVRVD